MPIATAAVQTETTDNASAYTTRGVFLPPTPWQNAYNRDLERQSGALHQDLGAHLYNNFYGLPITQQTIEAIAGNIKQWYAQNISFETTANAASTVTQTFVIPKNVYIDADTTSGSIRVTQQFDSAVDTTTSLYNCYQYAVPNVQTSGTLTIRSNVNPNAVRWEDATGNIWDTPIQGIQPGEPWQLDWKPRPIDRKEMLRRKIKEQLAPQLIIKRPIPDFTQVQESELNALRLLRQMIDAESFKKYLKYGIVVVEGPSGLTYQMWRNGDRITVRSKGKVTARLCIHLKNEHSMPPTDQVIAKMLLAECDEPGLWKRSNVHSFDAHTQRIDINTQLLAQVAA